MNTARPRRPSPRHARGVGLVEVMVASTIAALVIVGTVQVYSDSRNTYAIHESASHLEENARYVFSVIEPDLRMASFWGLMKGSGVNGAVGQAGATATDLANTSATVCGNNFSVDLNDAIEGSNDGYGLGCQAYNNRAMATTDTLTVRRASFLPSTVAANTVGPLRLCSTRISAWVVKRADVAATCPAAPVGTVNDLIVHTYYVGQDSSTANGTPTLWRKSLTSAAAPTFTDEEILPGVEDLQVQFGVDPTGTTGVATQYVDPLAAAALPLNAQIVAVRIWVLLRSESPEPGFTDGRTYQYANRLLANGAAVANLNTGGAAGRAYRPGDNFRRLLVSRTIMIRNALGT